MPCVGGIGVLARLRETSTGFLPGIKGSLFGENHKKNMLHNRKPCQKIMKDVGFMLNSGHRAGIFFQTVSARAFLFEKMAQDGAAFGFKHSRHDFGFRMDNCRRNHRITPFWVRSSID